jgi:hypothetical protein
MSTTPVLALPDFSKQFIVETDTYDQGLGAILKQGAYLLLFLASLWVAPTSSYPSMKKNFWL